MDLKALFAGHEAPAITLGQMLGSADLLSQVSDRSYPERCFYHLYPELVLAGCDRVRTSDGQEQLLYSDAFDLLSKSPRFYENIVLKRLNQDFQQVARHLAVHFAGADPYADAHPDARASSRDEMVPPGVPPRPAGQRRGDGPHPNC